MKLQTAYDALAAFLNNNGGGVLEQEALKSLAAYCKGIETKQGNGNALKPAAPMAEFQAAPQPEPTQAVQQSQEETVPQQQPSSPMPPAPAQKHGKDTYQLPSHSRPISRRLKGMAPPAAPPAAQPAPMAPGTQMQSPAMPTPNQQRPAFSQPSCGMGPMPKTPKTQQQRGRPWTVQEEAQLTQEFQSGMSACDMAAAHHRTVEAIAARLKENLHLIRDRSELVGYDDYRKAIGSPRKETPADVLWSAYEERQLRKEFADGMTGQQIAAAHHRTVGAIAKRLFKLHIIKSFDELPGYNEYVQALHNQGNP